VQKVSEIWFTSSISQKSITRTKFASTRGIERKGCLDELYNKKYIKFLYCQCMKSFVVQRYQQVVKHRNLVYTPTTYAKTTNQNLDWDDFKDFYALIRTSKDSKAYA
jgi:hypothetical protein